MRPGWGEEDAVAAVARFAEVVDEVARRIEAAIDAETDQRVDDAGESIAPPPGTATAHPYAACSDCPTMAVGQGPPDRAAQRRRSRGP
jgi:hypothetical protein